MRVLTVVGARPQFIKAAVVSQALQGAGISEEIVHTGQHYDANMSAVFFEELDIPAPSHNLKVGSGSHATQTGAMMVGLESFMSSREGPDWVLVYGDTNSTIAAAIVASKMGLPVAHVEAGLRSFNLRMPEEVNRIVTDRLSTMLFCPTQTAVEHLAKEGMWNGVHMSGDVMLDATRTYSLRAADRNPLKSITSLDKDSFYLGTIHRAQNTDNPARLAAIIKAFSNLDAPIILPLHPRTRSKLDLSAIGSRVQIIEPVSYLSMLTLITSSIKVLTDSGGLQKEAIWLGKPCVTLRDETEWTETLSRGWNHTTGADTDAILSAVGTSPEGEAPRFGEAPAGSASSEIVRLLSG